MSRVPLVRAWTQAHRDPTAEWLETDGLGGFASGCASGIRTRRYHALLLAALTPPTGRHVLVNDVDVTVETARGASPLSSHRYAGDVVYPDGASRIDAFSHEPWPCWRCRLEGGAFVVYEVMVPHHGAGVLLRWTLVSDTVAATLPAATLRVRPFLSVRDAHVLTTRSDAFKFDAELNAGRVAWLPYPALPVIAAYSNGTYTHAPDWYRQFLYTEERSRGLDDTEDLAAPGVFSFELTRGPAILALVAEGATLDSAPFDRLRAAAADTTSRRDARIKAAAVALGASEQTRRSRFPSPLHRAADAYIVHRNSGLTVIAGYPWFTDWGRDTFIALRGLCFAGGRLDAAGAILEEWAATVSEGMVPNRFIDDGDVAEFNSVDASLWYAIAAMEYLDHMKRRRRHVADPLATALRQAVEAILDGYTRGTRYGIRLDDDGLIAAGQPGAQLTWMDAKVGDWVVTPRTGKPVEIQALWLNALKLAQRYSDRWEASRLKGQQSFGERFWNPATGGLFDVVDVDHIAGTADGTIRPNMLFAIGGLPESLIEGARARSVVDLAEQELWTPMGPRSLAPSDPRFCPVHTGPPLQRDGAYHQGTVWPWLAGPFVEAWLRVHGTTPETQREARERFVAPLLAHLEQAGLGHVSEIADGASPHTPKGCPFQAWSVGELLRLVDLCGE